MVDNISDSIMIVVVDEGYTVSPIRMCIWVTGRMINSMVMGYMFMQMGRNIKGNLLMVRNKVEGTICIRVGQVMMDNGIRIVNMGLDCLYMRGMRVDRRNIKGIG